MHNIQYYVRTSLKPFGIEGVILSFLHTTNTKTRNISFSFFTNNKAARTRETQQTSHTNRYLNAAATSRAFDIEAVIDGVN